MWPADPRCTHCNAQIVKIQVFRGKPVWVHNATGYRNCGGGLVTLAEVPGHAIVYAESGISKHGYRRIRYTCACGKVSHWMQEDNVRRSHSGHVTRVTKGQDSANVG